MDGKSILHIKKSTFVRSSRPLTCILFTQISLNFSQPHGRAWKIHNKELLIREVVPKYFVQSKYESFTRQIVGWGFKRLHQSGNDFNAFYHECFLKDLPHLTVLMKRVSPNQGKLLPHVEGEPNFYEIHVLFPLPSKLKFPHHAVVSDSETSHQMSTAGNECFPFDYPRRVSSCELIAATVATTTMSGFRPYRSFPPSYSNSEVGPTTGEGALICTRSRSVPN